MITARAFQGGDDHLAMASLAQRFAEEHLHISDLPYRFCSWAFEEPENVRLWFDGRELAGWAALQTPFWSIDIAVHPQQVDTVYAEVLVWAQQRARQVQAGRFARPAWFVNVFERQLDRRGLLEAVGFADQASVDEDSWSKVWLSCPLTGEAVLQPVLLKAGYSLRSLAGVAEVPGYVALHRLVFQSESMTEAWRKRTLEHPAYLPELDLVVQAPDGSLAAFCVLWLLRDEAGRPVAGQVEPMGVHPEHLRIGLGRAILSEGLRRLIKLGAPTAYVETDNYRDAAFQLYEAVGFRLQEKVLVYRKDF